MNLPEHIAGTSPDLFADLFIREIEEGITGTGIKAGILKTASDISGVTEWQETILHAVARAHHITDVPIMLHSDALEQVARQQLAILKEEGVDLSRVAVDHVNDNTDMEYLNWLLEQGCYLGMDRYPGYNVNSLDRTKTMKTLIDAGYAERLFPSHDYVLAEIQGMSPDAVEYHEVKEKSNPHGFLYLKKVVFPQLREMGIPESILNQLCVTNPRNFFEDV
jgi:phosphotriesterase-related protein